jgi:hypothetical protein
MPVSYTHRDLDAPLHAAERCLGLFMETLGEEALDTMLDVAPEQNSDLKDGLKIRKTGRFERTIVGEAEHTEAVLTGTGLYGPEKRCIMPTRAEALHFFVNGEEVFARSVKGQKPQNFAGRTLDIEVPRLDTYMAEAAAITRRSFG